MSDYSISTNPPTILTVVIVRTAGSVAAVPIPIIGTGLVSATAGVVDALSTLRARVAADAANLRTDLGLGNSATRNVGTTAGTVAAGDDARLVPLIAGAYGNEKPHILGVMITPSINPVIARDSDLPNNWWWWNGTDWV